MSGSNTARPSAQAGGGRDAEREAFYNRADRGDPMHWRDIGPDDVWNAAWDAATKTEREACAKICESLRDEAREKRLSNLALKRKALMTSLLT